ncbi:hypothetical protein [Frankia sp. AvcI1]|uniref:hypothetical protein n=2 Tax=Frankia sp. AvcI1 TaxID=573496 RepID=UPI0021192DDB|nr:hypothetical protein [Frankia sp. AvcI1]
MPPFNDKMAPHRAGVLDLSPRTTAPEEPAGRVLECFEELGLSNETIRVVLGLSATYRRRRRAIERQMAGLAHELRTMPESLTDEGLVAREPLHARYAALFGELGMLGDEYVALVMGALSETEQLNLMELYAAEIRDELEALGVVIQDAVAPRFGLVGLDEPPGEPVGRSLAAAVS